MAISVVQNLGTTTSSGASVQSGNFTNPVTTGNTIIVLMSPFCTGAATISVTDSTGSNTYSLDQSTKGQGQSGGQVEIWRCSNVTGGSNFSVTVSVNTGNLFISFGVIEVSGLTNSSPADGSGSTDTGTSANPDSGAITTTNANDLLVGVVGWLNTTSSISDPTNPSAWTNVFTQPSGSVEPGDGAYLIVSSTQSSLTPQWTISASQAWFGCAMAYQASGGGGAALGNYAYNLAGVCAVGH